MTEQKRFVLQNVEVEYFRLIGAPHQNYAKDGTEWTCNFLLTKDHLDTCKGVGMAKAYVKTNKEDQPMIKFSKKGEKRDGSQALAPDVRDRYGDKWDPRTLVGNGSRADIIVMLNVMESGPNKGKLKPFVIKTVIRDHVPYEMDDGIEYDTKDSDAQEGPQTSMPEEEQTEGGDW